MCFLYKTLKPNLSTRLGSQFKQQSRQVNFYYMLDPLLLFFLFIDTAWTVHKITIFFWLPCTKSLLTHAHYITFIVFMKKFFERIFQFCFLDIHLSLYPLLWWSLGHGSAVLKNCITEQAQVRWREMWYSSKLPQQDNIPAHHQCCFQTAVYGT